MIHGDDPFGLAPVTTGHVPPAYGDMHREVQRLRKENAELRERIAEAQARDDMLHPERQVFVKPQNLNVLDAVESLPDARPGDILREAGTGREWVRGEGGNAWMGVE